MLWVRYLLKLSSPEALLNPLLLPGHEKVLADKSILLLEGSPKFKGFPVDGEFSNRVSTLNSGTLRLLEQIGVWDRIKSVRANPVYDMQVSLLNSTSISFINPIPITRSGTPPRTPLSPSTKDPTPSLTSSRMISSWTLSTNPWTHSPTSPSSTTLASRTLNSRQVKPTLLQSS